MGIGFEDLEDAINKLNDAANVLFSKKEILGKDKLHIAIESLREFKKLNGIEPEYEWDIDDTDYRERNQEAADYFLDSWGF